MNYGLLDKKLFFFPFFEVALMAKLSKVTAAPTYTPKVRSAKGYRLTERELDVLEFILEMKFSTLEALYSKFFKVTKWGSTSNSLIWAKQRISHLVKTEMVQILTEVCNRPLYVLTQKGYRFLKNSRPTKNYCRPLFDVDGRIFDHDQRVVQVRIALESSGLIKEWISESQLSEIDEVKKYLPTEFRPDAIYINPQGQKVAFELEIARKSKDRYHKKIKRYIQVMTEGNSLSRIFEINLKSDMETLLKFSKYVAQADRINDLQIFLLTEKKLSMPYNLISDGTATQLRDRIVLSLNWSEEYYKNQSSSFLLKLLILLCWLRDNQQLKFNIGTILSCSSAS